MAEPAVVVASIPLDGFGDGKGSVAQREIRCNGCRAWFDARFFVCPDCDEPRPGFNKRLRTAKLDNHLFSQAAKVEAQKTWMPRGR